MLETRVSSIAGHPPLTKMAATGKNGSHLAGDVDFIQTPKAAPSSFETGQDCGVKITNVRISVPSIDSC